MMATRAVKMQNEVESFVFARRYGAKCCRSHRIEASLDAYRERLLPFVPGQTREEKLEKCRLLFSSMAGVLMMARVTSHPQKREQRLTEARNFFIKSFALE